MIEYSRVKKIHFVGIGGSGMSGIAEVLHNMGFVITGSDISENASVKRLRSLGVRVDLGHDRRNVKGAETLVYSSAITERNVEVQEARRRKLPVIPRAEMLAELMRVKFSIAVAGTHGKTTTTSMLSSVLSHAGKDPTYVVGGKLKVDESGAKLGKSDYLIAEADESDGSFLRLYPTVAVITNIEDDHLDHYGTMDNLLQAFETFCNKVPFYGSVILNTDCANSRGLVPRVNKRVMTYGLTGNPRIGAKNIADSLFKVEFDLVLDGKGVDRFSLNAGGRHNVANALATTAAAMEIGLDTSQIREGLQRFFLPERRFQVLFYDKNHLVIDDYAHHPTEIRATIDTLKRGDFRRVWVVFQPHRFTRLSILMDRFAAAFTGVDRVIIAKLYAAGQKRVKGTDGRILTEKIAASGCRSVDYVEDFSAIQALLHREIQPGDAVAFLSAGDLTRAAHEFAGMLEDRIGEGGTTRT